MVDDLPVIEYQTLASSKLAIDRGDVELEEERICLNFKARDHQKCFVKAFYTRNRKRALSKFN